jgi:hypothetical protein
MPIYKAMQCKIVLPTRTKPRRIKVWVEGFKPETYSVYSFGDTYYQALHSMAAQRFREARGWTEGQWVEGELSPGHSVHVRVV